MWGLLQPTRRGSSNPSITRAARGAPPVLEPGGAAALHHASLCSGTLCEYDLLDVNTYVCRSTGCVHVCGDACMCRVEMPAGELPVCRISGRCFESLMHPTADGEGAEEGDCGEGARLGAAFEQGYYAESEEDLIRIQCSV